MLTEAWRVEFDRTGIAKIPGAFGRAEAMRMQAVVWRELGRRYGIERDDPSTWNRHPPTGLISSKKSAAFAPICGPVVAAMLTELLGNWRPPKHFGNVLVTMPDAASGECLTASGTPTSSPPWWWPIRCQSSRCGLSAMTSRPVVVARHSWSVRTRCSRRYVERTGERDYKRAKFGFLASHPWLADLSRDAAEPARTERCLSGTEIDGIDVRVVECTGCAGDVYITHPWVFHSIAPNATDRPRLMRSVAVWGAPLA